MASRIYAISVTVPAGTPIANPQVTPWKTEDATIVSIELDIPTGHSGKTGIRVVKGDTQLIPWGSNSWIIGSGIDHDFPVGQYLPTGDMKIQAYNIGTFPHTFYLRMTVEDYVQPKPSSAPAGSAALPEVAGPASSDPLSPDVLLGPDTASSLANGTITANDVAPLNPPEHVSTP